METKIVYQTAPAFRATAAGTVGNVLVHRADIAAAANALAQAAQSAEERRGIMLLAAAFCVVEEVCND